MRPSEEFLKMNKSTEPEQTIYFIECPKCEGTGYTILINGLNLTCSWCDGAGKIKAEK